MSRYITLVELTQEGVENLHRLSNDVSDLGARAANEGGEVSDVYATLGRYDMVVVSEFPDDESYTSFALSLASEGRLTTETLTALTDEQFVSILEGIAGVHKTPTGEQEPT